MKISINRIRRNDNVIEGQLYVDGIYTCDTLENETDCLPTGRYGVVINKCHQHARKMPLVVEEDTIVVKCCGRCKHRKFVSHNTPMPRYCPQLSAGNGVYNRHDGSILVGKRGAFGLLLYPKETFDNLYQRIRKAMARGRRIIVYIR